MSRHEIPYGEDRIGFTLEHRDRKTLSIEVHPDCSVVVIAPLSSVVEEVLEVVHRRRAWIVRQQEYFRGIPFPVPTHEYVSGETHRYLGRQYLLKVIGVGEAAEESVKLIGPNLRVCTTAPKDRVRTERLVQRWYRTRARIRFTERLGVCHERVRRYGIPLPELRIQSMPKRWGSCTPSGRILLNPLLIQAPTPCIDYVITHELCHRKVMRHDREFYRLLERVMPDWGERKGRLEKTLQIHNGRQR